MKELVNCAAAPAVVIAGPPQQPLLSVTDDGKSLQALLETFRRDGTARILAEPTLVTLSGRPVSFCSGGELSATTGGGLGLPSDVTGSIFVGTRVDLSPTLIAPDRIRVDMNLAITEPVKTGSGGQAPPAVKKLNINTGVEMNSGQTFVLAGPSRQAAEPKAGPEESTETLFLVFAEIVDPPLTAQAR
ncbi:MAG: hypothetical protein ACYC6Y_11100 [Thermoguttaceae bacterium]